MPQITRTSRFLGLSKNASPAPLLRQVGGMTARESTKRVPAGSRKRKAHDSDSEPEPEPEPERKPRPEPAVEDPPLSSSGSDDTGDESNRKASFQPIKFSKKGLDADEDSSSTEGEMVTAKAASVKPSSRRASKFEHPPVSGSGFDDIEDSDLERSSSRPTKKDNHAGVVPFGSQHSQISSQRSLSHKYGGSKKPQTKARKILQDRKVVKPPRPPRKKGRPKSPEPAKFAMPDDTDSPSSPSNQDSRFIDVLSATSSATNGPKTLGAAGASGSSPVKAKSVFQCAFGLSDDEMEPTSSRTYNAASASSDTSELSDIDSIADPSASICPMCDAPVDAELYKGLSTNYMSISEQQKFCRRHKFRDSQVVWKEKGYPDINWDGLEERFEKHSGHLLGVLEAKKPSHYRNQLSDRVQSGKGRTLLTSKTSLTPGYYGFRGLRVMTEYLIGRFTDQLRRQAIEDRLVSARGHMTFVQSVLVPELTIQLIMEDLGIGAEAARDVLGESVQVGEILHEEIRDVVCDPDSEEG